MSSVCKCVDDTVLGSYVVVTVPWEVQVSVSGFSVHPYSECSICFWSDDSIQKRYRAIFFCLLYSKLDRWIYCIDVLEELFLMCLMLQHKGIIYNWVELTHGFMLTLTDAKVYEEVMKIASLNLEHCI